MKKNDKKNVIIFLITTIFIFVSVFLLATDHFYHGFYSNAPQINQIKEKDIKKINIKEKTYTVNFSPQEKNLKGFDIILSNLSTDEIGTLVIEIKDNKGKIIETINQDINQLKNLVYYKTYIKSELKQYNNYLLNISCKDVKGSPKLLTIKNNKNQPESKDNLLIGYAYAKPTFTLSERILFIVILLSIWIFIGANLLASDKLKKKANILSIIVFLTALMAWNYSFNIFDKTNTKFENFQKDSENLVTNVIYNGTKGVYLDDYGLGRLDPATKDLTPYRSQYGLQGKVFLEIEKIRDYKIGITTLNLLCSIVTALVFILIVLLINKKYNKLMAGCFYCVFLLSPWIVNFARNLYWVEFTWFVPMLVGLFCSIFINNRKCRILSYIGAFLSILIKCLCGYEYISTIMMGLITFILIDAIKELIAKNKDNLKLYFKTIIVLGLSALLGFLIAICIHAVLRGDGSILNGISSIVKEDVLRRTYSNDLNSFTPVYQASINSSVWEVLCKYFNFSTNIIPGITGNMFPLLSFIPLVILFYNYLSKNINWEDALFYIIFLFNTTSWFILGKSHSYVHVHMNYVLWYTGYIQICFYIIIKQIIKRKKTNTSGGKRK